MQLYPTRPAAHLAIAGIAVAALGVASGEAALVGWGGALIVAVAVARAVTLVSVARIRAAGFEMLWTGTKRVTRTSRGSTIEVEAEVRNRDTLSARYVKLRALASPNLDIKLEPPAGEVTACGRLKVKVKIGTPRVGQHGVYGLALEVRGAPGMFEVPLTFANPFGIEVAPRPFSTYLKIGGGGPSNLMSPSGKAGRLRGDGSSLRELRELQPGDPFKRIAWKASAKRGKLLVREHEREERDVVWIVLDVSVELWSGPVGRAPLDLLIDEAAALASRYLARGDRVGLAVFAEKQRATILPDSGIAQAHKILNALTTSGGTLDASRSDLDELDVAVRVIEHLRPLDDRGLADVPRTALDRLAQRADAMRPRAPFRVRAPEGRTERDATLRRYLASFGVDSPPKTASDRALATNTLTGTLAMIARLKPKPSIIHILAGAPVEQGQTELTQAIRRLRRTGAFVAWALPTYDPSLSPPWHAPRRVDDEIEVDSGEPAFDKIAADAALAVRIRANVALKKSEHAIEKMGARVSRVRPAKPPPVVPAEPAPEPAASSETA